MLRIVETSMLPVLTCPEPTEKMDRIAVKEVFAKAVKEWKGGSFALDLSNWIALKGTDCLRDAAEGILLALYKPAKYSKKQSEEPETVVELIGLRGNEEAKEVIRETEHVVKGIVFARNMTNMPGNMLRPLDFAGKVAELVEQVPVEVEILSRERLAELGMNAMLAVGDSSAYPPCLAILRYRGNPDTKEITGLVGKGVTCDTGGYCLKNAGSMMGIRGDMAGGAAVAGAIYALAANGVKVNVTGLIPMCENRISPGSYLPGDVITAYDGQTIQIVNTDAEGRLMLGDAVAYAVRTESVSQVVDIATLTGAAVGITAFGAAPCLAEGEAFYEEFLEGIGLSGERYLRLPIYPEYEKMIESEVADMKNSGGKFAGTITAGLFIRKFAAGRPWIHLDIAGTSWVEKPIYEFQAKGATGAGVTSMYYLCRRKGRSL
ncbi:MAG: hypothetical protein Q4F41_00865 [Eubacteriales bacterium]|nr:hypothetical protein [Eubacteriales bacterium]